MADLINGKHPDEIKRWVDSRVRCDECTNNHEVGCEQEERTKDCQMCIDTLAYIERLEATIERFGDFGKLFMEYTGCPRGATGRADLPLAKEVLAMKPIRDVDGGEWIPVNADALRELVAEYKKLCDAVPKWIGVEEDLPKDREFVRMYTADHCCFEGIYIIPTGFERYEIGEGWINENDNVTHWMSLPKPPKGDA